MEIDGVVAKRSNASSGSGKMRKAWTPYVLAQATPLSGIWKFFSMSPKLLLQLQELSSGVRPQPIFDVMTSNIFTPSPSLAQMGFSKGVQQGWKIWGESRIMVFKSDDYHTAQDQQRNRGAEPTVAVIVGQGKNSQAEIFLVDGSTWKASCHPNGVFEFVLDSKTKDGLPIARWRPVRMEEERTDVPLSATAEVQRFEFSMVHSQRRQNPVLASLTRTRLKVAEHRAAKDYDCDPSRMDGRSHEHPSDGPGDSEVLREGAPHWKTLIQVTAIWVALLQGWCAGLNTNGYSL